MERQLDELNTTNNLRETMDLKEVAIHCTTAAVEFIYL